MIIHVCELVGKMKTQHQFEVLYNTIKMEITEQLHTITLLNYNQFNRIHYLNNIATFN